jgi:Recombination directionality factor-like
MIIGVTHDQDGRVVQRLSVSTKVSIGLPPNGDRNHPTKLDHFVFLRKKKTARGVEWEPDPELTEHYGAECRELHIMLIDDDIENVFPSSYAWWTATERKCWGDGTSASRRTAEKPAGQPWTPCGSGCPELASGLCKPSGDLRFVLADFPRLGSVCRIHTSSYRSIRQIHSALQEIQTFTGGRLAGITGKLVVRPEEITYFDRKEKRKKTTSVWVLSLEVEGDDMRKLIANLTENARLFAETRRLLGPAGKVFEVVEEEQEQAPEINGEFYPPPANGSSVTDGNGTGQKAAVSADPLPGNGRKDVRLRTRRPGRPTASLQTERTSQQLANRRHPLPRRMATAHRVATASTSCATSS